jgi:hypothetical protein
MIGIEARLAAAEAETPESSRFGWFEVVDSIVRGSIIREVNA